MNRLHVKSLVSVGAVEAGDDPNAEILLFKSKSADESANPNGREPMSELDLASLDEAVRKQIEAHIESEIAAAVVVEVDDAPVLTDLPEPVAKKLAEQDDEIAKTVAANESLQKELDTVRDEQLTERFTKRASELVSVLGDSDEIAGVLKTIAVAAPEASKTLDAKLDEAVKMVKASDALMFKELGTSNDESDPVVKHLAIAKQIHKDEREEFKTLASAKAEAWRRNPDLKAETRVS